MHAQLLAQGGARLFPLPQRGAHRQVLIVVALLPASLLMLAHPALMLHRGDELHLFGRELRHHVVVHGPVGKEAAERVEKTAEAAGAAERGELVGQRHALEAALHLPRGGGWREAAPVQRDREIVQVHEAAVGQIGVLVLPVHRAQVRLDRQRALRGVDDFPDVGHEALLLLGHVAVCLEPRRFPLLAPFFPGPVFDDEGVDLLPLGQIVMVGAPDGLVREVEADPQRVQLGAGIAPVGGAIPALQLVAEHQHPGQGVLVHAQRGLRVFVLVVVDLEFENAVVQHDGRQHVHMHPCQVAGAAAAELSAQPRSAEHRVVHEIAVVLRRDGLGLDHVPHEGLVKAVGSAQLFGQIVREQRAHGLEAQAVQLPEARLRRFVEAGQRSDVAVDQIGAARAALLPVHLEVAEHLLVGQLEGVADVVKQRRQPPEFQKGVGRAAALRAVALVGVKAVKTLELPAEGRVRLVDRQSQCEHIDRVGVVIPVLEQQRAAVFLVFAQQLHHLLRAPVAAEEHLQKAVVDHVGVLGHSRVDKDAQRAFEAQAVRVHLHVVRDLPFAQALAEQHAGFPFEKLLFPVEAQALALLAYKAQRGAFEPVGLPARRKRRLHGAEILPEALQIVKPHHLKCRISHADPVLYRWIAPRARRISVPISP